jgi:hypothetical protein
LCPTYRDHFISKADIYGIKECGNGYMVSHYEGNLFLVTHGGQVEELLITRDEKN